MTQLGDNFLPAATGQDLGSSTQQWDAFLQNCDVYSSLTLHSGATITAANSNGVRVATQFDWSQSPGGTLSAGACTVTLSPVPPGVNGTDANHYLYISSVGTPEAVLITGGTAVAGATSGTITFTAANSHGTGFTIGSATAGIMEAFIDAGGPTIVQVVAGAHNVYGTVYVGPGQRIVGTAPKVLGEGSQTTTGGSVLVWGGATDTPIVYVKDASGALVDGIIVDANGVSGAIPFQYWSDNSPESSKNELRNISAKGFTKYGIVLGLASTTADTNGYQADTIRIEGFQLYGSGTTAIGILINSANAASNSVIERGNIQGCNIGVRGVKTNALAEFRRFNGGGPVGSSPVFMQFDAAFGPYICEGMETEGSWTYAVHDSTSLATPNNSTWIFCSWNTTAGTVLVDGNSTITSIGGTTANTTTFTLSGSAKAISINDAGGKFAAGANVVVLDGNGLNSGAYAVSSATGAKPGSIAAGDIAAVRGTDSGDLWLGSDGAVELRRDTGISSSITLTTGLIARNSIVASNGGTTPSGISTSDLASVRSATSGIAMFGSDGKGYILRDIDNQSYINSGTGTTAGSQTVTLGNSTNGGIGNLTANAATLAAKMTAATAVVTAATPSTGAGQVGFGNDNGFGNGSAGTAVTTTAKGTGTGPTSPQTVVKYWKINVAGSDYWVPLMQ